MSTRRAKIQKPFLPYVTLGELLLFDPERPETYTASPLVNAVMEAMFQVKPLSGAAVAKYLNLTYADMRGGMMCATGHAFQEIQYQWTLHRIWKVLHDEPGLSTDQVARRAGFTTRSPLWNFLHKHGLVHETGNCDYEPRNNILKLWREDRIPADPSTL